jgi:RNA polymerase sigma-70 factor (ECF subfamily)
MRGTLRPIEGEAFDAVDPARAAELTDLLGRIQSGDRSAEQRLFSSTRFALWMILRRRGCSPAEADDLVQETLLVALRRVREGSLEHPERFDGFLYVTALNLQRTHARNERRQPSLSSIDDEAEEHLHGSSDPLAEVDTQQRRKMLEQILASLSQARDRELLRRHYLDEADKEATCTALGLDSAHYDRVLFRARQRLGKLLGRWLE